MRSRVLFVHMLVAAAVVLAACGGGGGDDDDGDTGVVRDTPTAIPNDPGPSPDLSGPASLYSISQDDLGPGFITDIEFTYTLTAENYGSTTPFQAMDGVAKLKEWGYASGYETSYTPEGRTTATLNGAYYIKVETHLMEDEAGAQALFNFFRDAISKASEPVTTNAIGNEFGAWRRVGNPVGDSSTAGEFHQYVFRRGNLVGAVLTWGAEPFMDVTTVYQLAHIIDQKALGEVELVEPTPVFTATAN